ncbi:MAG: amino acid ABC transporter substrate-binding protein [Sulfolobales archaeon]
MVSRNTIIFLVSIIIVYIIGLLSGLFVSTSLYGYGPSVSVLTATYTYTHTYTKSLTYTYTPATLPATTPTLPTLTPPATLPSEIVIGLAVPLTGSQADVGKAGFNGIQAAVRWVNEVYGGVHLFGKSIPVRLVYYDDESSKDKVISYTERLITVDKVHFLLSSYSSPLVFAQAPIAEKYNMLLINWGGASDTIHQQGYKMIVMVWTPASKYMVQAVEALLSYNKNPRIVLLYKDDEFNRAVAAGVRDYVKKLNITLAYDKAFPADIKDFTPYLAEIAPLRADALIGGTHFADGQLLTKQLADQGIDFKFIALNIAPCYTQYYDAFKTLAEGILCPSHWEMGASYTPDIASKLGAEWFGPTEDQFVKYYRTIVGDPNARPPYHAASGAAAVLLLIKAIEKAQSLDPVKVRAVFNDMYVVTFFGEFKIDPSTGLQIAHKMILVQWQRGNLVPVWPPEVAKSKLVYPIPTWDEKRAGKVASP